jgi:membrane-associated phospholipid phosphatase
MAMPSRVAPAETQREPRRHDWRHVVLGTLLAFAVPLAVGSLIGALIRGLGGSDGSNAIDTSVLHWMIARRSDDLTSIVRGLTMLGGSLVLVPLTVFGVVVLASLRRVWLAGYLATVVIGASLLSSTTKALVGRPRPPVAVRAAGVGGSAFPSGHATQAAATYVALAIIAWVMVASPTLRKLLGIVLAVIATSVGLSRLYLGVHWFSDVVAGWLVGTAWAVGAARAFRPLGTPGITAARSPT